MNWKSSGQCRSKNSSDHRCTQESCRCSALSSLQLDIKQPRIKSKEKIRDIKIQEDFRKDKWKAIRIARIAPFCLRSLLPYVNYVNQKLARPTTCSWTAPRDAFPPWQIPQRKNFCVFEFPPWFCSFSTIQSWFFPTKWPISWVEFLGLFGESSTIRQYETTSLKKHIYVATINP